MTQIIAKVNIDDLLKENFINYEILMSSKETSILKTSILEKTNTITTIKGKTIKNKKKLKSIDWLSIDLIETNSNDYLPHPILPGTIAEGSLHYNSQSNQWIITSLDVLESNIRVCSSYSNRIEDLWNCQYVSGIEPRWRNERKYMTYAAKSHPEFLNQQINITILQSKYLSTYPQNTSSIFSSVNRNQISHHGIISYVANPIKGPNFLFDEQEKETYCPTFLYY